MQSFLLTSSMDGTVKIWCPGSGAAEVINATPEFKYPEEDAPPAGGGRHSYRQQVRAGSRTVITVGVHVACPAVLSGLAQSQTVTCSCLHHCGDLGMHAHHRGLQPGQQLDGAAHCYTVVVCCVGQLQDYAGIVTMCATMDHAQKSVLMLSSVRDRSIKLLELPAFSERGVLPDVSTRGYCHGRVEAVACSDPASCVAKGGYTGPALQRQSFN